MGRDAAILRRLVDAIRARRASKTEWENGDPVESSLNLLADAVEDVAKESEASSEIPERHAVTKAERHDIEEWLIVPLRNLLVAYFADAVERSTRDERKRMAPYERKWRELRALLFGRHSAQDSSETLETRLRELLDIPPGVEPLADRCPTDSAENPVTVADEVK